MPVARRSSRTSVGIAAVVGVAGLLAASVAQDGGTLLTHGADSVFLAGVAPRELSLSDLI